MKKSLALLRYACILAAFAACAAPLRTDAGRLAIAVSISEGTRSLYPDISVDVAGYDILGSGPDGATFSLLDVGAGTHPVPGLAAGQWTISVIGKNDTETEIVGGAAAAEVKSSETTTVTITCLPIVGEGTLALAVSWPADLVPSPRVEASLAPVDGDEAPLSFEIAEPFRGFATAAIPDTTLRNGSYILSFELRDSSSPAEPALWGALEPVLIMKGARTAGAWTLDSDAISSGGIEIMLDGEDAIGVTLAGGEAEVLRGYPLSVSASADQEGVAWRWYLNATPVKGRTSRKADLVMDTAPLEGSYRLNALARKGGGYGSGSFAFRVRGNDSDMAALSGLTAGYACNGAEVAEPAKGVYVLSSGPGDGPLASSELVGKNRTDPPLAIGEYRGGKAFLGIPVADGRKLTSDFKVGFSRTILDHPASMADPSACMYFNLIVEGEAVHNAKGGTGVLVAATPAAGTSVLLDGSAIINNISGGTIDGIKKNESTLADLAAKDVSFVNAVTNDNGTPIGIRLAAILIVVGDSRGADSKSGNMSNVTMRVSDLSYDF